MIKLKYKHLDLICVMLCLVWGIHAQVSVNPLFNNNMILQRNAPIPIFGEAADGDELTVTLAGKVLTTTAQNGKWNVTFPAQKAGGPITLKVEAAGTRIAFTNIMMGDVWLCTGQSNMATSISTYVPGGKNNKGYTEFDNVPGSYSNGSIRIMSINTKGSNQLESNAKVQSPWATLTPQTALDFSATAYFFGKSLQPKVDVPIGLIRSALGGTKISEWMPASSLTPLDAPTNKQFEKRNKLYNAMIHPLHQIPVKGIIWYQGEGDCYQGYAQEYSTVFPELIKSWRAAWKKEDLPFIFAQLASYKKLVGGAPDGYISRVRDAQFSTWKNTNNTGLVVATDAGLENNIHPPYKKLLGDRFANIALKLAYKQTLNPYGPQYKSVSFTNGKALLEFEHAASGLEAKGITLNAYLEPYVLEQGKLYGFTIAGNNKVFYQAYAKITNNNKVEVWAPEVPAPTAVRYAWANFALCNLYNSEGLPTAPFRTDNFPFKSNNGTKITAPKVEKFRVYTPQNETLIRNKSVENSYFFPNPLNGGVLSFKADSEQMLDIRLFDMHGKCFHAINNKKAFEIHHTSFPSKGVYLAKVQTRLGTQVEIIRVN